MDYFIIQVGNSAVDVGIFAISAGNTVLKGAQSFELSHEQNLSQIATLLADGISGSPRVVLSVPPDLVAGRIVELPLSDLKKVREVLPPHLQGELPTPTDELVFEVTPSKAGSFLALWAKRSEVKGFVETFKNAGIEPQFVTASPLSYPFIPGLPPDSAIFDGTTLALIENSQVSAIKTFTGDGVGEDAIRYLFALQMSGFATPETLSLFGAAADQEYNVGEGLKLERLELPEEFASIFRTDATFQHLAGLYAVAQACHRNVLVNFRRGDLVWRADDAVLQKKIITTASLLLVVIFLLFGVKFMQYRAAVSDLASLNSSISNIYKEMFPSRSKAIDEISEVKGELKKMGAAGSSRGALDLLQSLAEAKGNRINGLFETEIDGNNVRVKGDAPSTVAVNEFKTALESKFTSVQLGETKSRPDGTVGFTLSATAKENR